MVEKVSRNAPCPCGSTRRYKDCHGAVVRDNVESDFASTQRHLYQALELQKVGKIEAAAALYESVLRVWPQHFDAQHMLGVIRYEQLRDKEAALLIVAALDACRWANQSALHNLGLVLGRMLAAGESLTGLGALGRAYRSRDLKSHLSVVASPPLISVVIPSYNHAPYLLDAVDSVRAQTYRNWELRIIDDGSTDVSNDVLAQIERSGDERISVYRRGNRGAPATLNELIESARGEWIQPLNSDDRLAADRLQTMLDACGSQAARWAFGGVRCIDREGNRIDEMRDSRAFTFRMLQSELSFFETISQSFFSSNGAISTGNLFVRRDFFQELGGFADHRYHHDWEFCLRASRLAEPLFVESPSYFYRLHDSNTISEKSSTKQVEINQILATQIDLGYGALPKNPWMPSYPGWGYRFIADVMARGLGHLLRPERMKDIATKALAES